MKTPTPFVPATQGLRRGEDKSYFSEQRVAGSSPAFRYLETDVAQW